MDVAEILLRALDDSGNVYLPYSFSDGYTEEEKKILRQELDKHVPEKVSATFNNWILSKTSIGFVARRATWESGGLTGKCAEELAKCISDYYNR